MGNRKSNRSGGYVALIVLTLLALTVATFLLVIVGKKLLAHEKSQTERIEALEEEKNTLNDSIISKDATIEELIDHLANAEKQIDALEDAYDLSNGKVKALEEWKSDIEKKIENGELGSTNKNDSKDDEEEKKDSKKDEKKDNGSEEKEPASNKESKSKGVYQKLVNGEDINLLIIGDSIGEPMDETAWPVLLQNWLQNTYKGKCHVKNVSMSANTSYAGYGRTMILPDADSYDLAIICYGHNDFDYGFGDMYELIIRAVQQKYPSCAIISILQSSQRDYTNKIKTIQSICEYYNIPTADTIKAFSNSGIAYDELAPDGVHPEGTGRKIYFDTIKDIIKNKVEKNETYTYAERSPIYETWGNYDKVKYYKASDFTRVDDLTYEIKGKFSGNIGMYYTKTSEITGFDFRVDGESIADFRTEWGTAYEVPMIQKVISGWVKAENKITIVFGTKACADEFEGMIYSR